MKISKKSKQNINSYIEKIKKEKSVIAVDFIGIIIIDDELESGNNLVEFAKEVSKSKLSHVVLISGNLVMAKPAGIKTFRHDDDFISMIYRCGTKYKASNVMILHYPSQIDWNEINRFIKFFKSRGRSQILYKSQAMEIYTMRDIEYLNKLLINKKYRKDLQIYFQDNGMVDTMPGRP